MQLNKLPTMLTKFCIHSNELLHKKILIFKMKFFICKHLFTS